MVTHTLNRGEIHWLEIEDLGRRPVLVLTSTLLLPSLQRVVVAGLTTTVRGVASEVPVGLEQGVPRESVINLLDLRVVSRALLVERITTLDETIMTAVCDALDFVTACERS